MGNTKISWATDVWNPTRGCRRVSPGCEHCYAERQAARFCGPGQPYEGLVELTPRGPRWTGMARFVPEMLGRPMTWRKPALIFVDSMSDLFHDDVTNEQIAAVFGVMAATPRHTYQVLTKHADRMPKWFAWLDGEARRRAPADPENPWWRVMVCLIAASKALGRITDIEIAADGSFTTRGDRSLIAGGGGATWPLPHVWLGTSTENQAAADERIPHLLATPAAVRFLSCEPLIGPVDLAGNRGGNDYLGDKRDADDGEAGIDWLIAGCESGPGARPCSVEWLRSLRDQCASAGVAFWLKQAHSGPGIGMVPGSKRKPGNLYELPALDDEQHTAMPGGARP